MAINKFSLYSFFILTDFRYPNTYMFGKVSHTFEGLFLLICSQAVPISELEASVSVQFTIGNPLNIRSITFAKKTKQIRLSKKLNSYLKRLNVW